MNCNSLGYGFSGGERKLVLLAMAKNLRLLILDEPTNTIDVLRKKLMWDLIRNFNNTLIMVNLNH